MVAVHEKHLMIRKSIGELEMGDLRISDRIRVSVLNSSPCRCSGEALGGAGRSGDLLGFRAGHRFGLGFALSGDSGGRQSGGLPGGWHCAVAA